MLVVLGVSDPMNCARCGSEFAAGAATCAACLAPIDSGIDSESTLQATTIHSAATTIAHIENTDAHQLTGIVTAVSPFSGSPTAMKGNGGPDVRVEQRSLREGADFGARYHLIRCLGAGGMGAVYQAWDRELSVAVALKVIRLPEGADASAARSFEERFKQELLNARKVTHKGVVRIHDLGVIDGVKYLTMSYVEGADLQAVLKNQGGRLPVRQVLAIAREVIDGLQAAHDAGVVHRDLKPANIMIDGATGHALITDFGLALSPSDGKPRHEGIVGTLAYMSPQQATGKAVDHRTDLYAFGMILYDLLGGRPLQRDPERAMADMLARIGSPPAPIRTINPDVPEAVEALINRCLEPSEDRRYQTAAQVAADLARLDEDGKPIPLPRSRRTEMLAAVTTLTVVLSVSGWWLGRRSQAPAAVHEPVSVLIADFDNRTGDSVFTGSLEQALSISVESASFITAYSREAAKRVVRQIRPDAVLDAETARLVSRREGINYVLTGAIEPRGQGYAVGVNVVDASTGRTTATSTSVARNRNEVLGALGSAAVRVRTALGDTPAKIAAQNSETFTAASLDAMSAYARGQELANATKNQEALAAYQQAVTMDPEFGRAYAGMGVVYTIFKDEAKARTAYEQALKHVSRMSEREKYRTLGTYYLSVARNYEKAIENYEALVRLYPGDAVGHGNLGLAYLNVGNLKRAVEEARAVMKISPKNSVQRYNLAMYSMYAGDLAGAANEGATILKESPSFELAYLPIALSRTIDGNLDGARETYDRLEATGASGAALARFGRTDLEMMRGRYTAAVKMANASIALDQHNNDLGALAQDYIVSAESSLALGMKAQAAVAASRAAGLSGHESILFPAARVLMQAGREDEAQRIAGRLENMLQQHTTAYARLVSAEIAVRHERYGEAIELFRDSIKRRDTWLARFLLGRTYAEADHFAEAMAELELCVNRRGEAADVFFYDTPSLRYLPPVYYWLARAQLAMGVRDAAQNYERFLALRADAAPPDPLAADAMRRLATLK